ncbi:MAG: aminotransferase class I/II-fold pyridoxal phosphate-dependent enzyme [Thermosynechococcaceae cyanobacterium MS004]|nr:aminotransferase class I/II-fold pyridoxal phosphate-dependent enzyme [Thermosynechococcaceae cyanobacterium MS004]
MTPQPSAFSTPIIAALKRFRESLGATFHTPGHNRGQQIPDCMEALIGKLPYQHDFPDLPGLSLFEADGAITQAQDLAAQLFGAERTWFLVNGSTVGILAAILAVCGGESAGAGMGAGVGTGKKIILPRNVHQSVISGLILSGAMPIYVTPESDVAWDLAYCITPESVAEALAQHPDASAVFMVSPTYHGVCGDISAIATLAHQHGIPLIVDEAHGAHFAFHADLPQSALAAGADLVVQSTHKLLAALTQSSMLHLQGSRIDADRVSRLLQMLQSSSPSSLLLASLDAARHQMSTQGSALMAKTLQLARQVRTQLQDIAGLALLEPPPEATSGFITLDPTRITVDLSALGTNGFLADEQLTHEFGVTAELPTLRQLTFIISLGNTSEDALSLVKGLAQLTQRSLNSRAPSPFIQEWTQRLEAITLPIVEMPSCAPRQAFFAPQESISLAASIGRISAETICPYPPGIPLLLPGQRITAQAIAQLQTVQALGGLILGAADPDLRQIQVVKC